MPTYEYECEQCGARFEVLQKISDAPLAKCPECDGGARRRLGTGAAVIVRGGSRRDAYENRASRCGRKTPCCGRDVPCAHPPCDD
jgi:putative FmdB family regulatory protein